MEAYLEEWTSAKYATLKVRVANTKVNAFKEGRPSHVVMIQKKGFFGIPRCYIYVASEAEANEIEMATLSLGATPW